MSKNHHKHTHHHHSHTHSHTSHLSEASIYLIGLVAVVIFALTLPMSKLAVGSIDAPQLTPWFASLGRAAGAGLLSIGYLLYTRARRPSGHEWGSLAAMALGNGLGFPLLQNWGLLYVSSSHAAVFNGALPLMTAAIATWVFSQKAPIKFWMYSLLAAACVIAFALLRAYQKDGVVQFHMADALIFAAVVVCGYGYAYGARLARTLPAAQGLCWMLVCLLPITLPMSAWLWPTHSVSTVAWWAFGYLAVFSMWLGMMLWYYALHEGGAVKISQIQIVQPFMTVLFAVPILGESLELWTVLFALVVMWLTYLGKQVPMQAKSAK